MTEQEIVEALSEERQRLQAELWDCEEWVPPFIELDNHKVIDYDGIAHDLDDKAWSLYYAGKIEAFDEAIDIIDELSEDESD